MIPSNIIKLNYLLSIVVVIAMYSCGSTANEEDEQLQLSQAQKDSISNADLEAFEIGKAQAEADSWASQDSSLQSETVTNSELTAESNSSLTNGKVDANNLEADSTDSDGDGVPDIEGIEPQTASSIRTAPSSRGLSEDDLKHPKEEPEVAADVKQTVALDVEDFKVKLAVDSNLKLGQTGDLRVWIGAAELERMFSKKLASSEATFPASVGQSAEITPYAPDFELVGEPFKCTRIVRDGAEVIFPIRANKTGILKVSAIVKIFDTGDCTGIPVPKSVETISVEVIVDGKEVVTGKLGEMGTVLWDSFMSFWGALVALIFAALLFVIRRLVKKKSGYEDTSA